MGGEVKWKKSLNKNNNANKINDEKQTIMKKKKAVTSRIRNSMLKDIH